MNSWHNVEIGKDAPEIVNSIIEIPEGSRAKYEIDKETGLLKLDRVLFSALYYPANYGFIPKTLGQDGDPLDILVLSQISIQPLCLVKAKVIGVVRMIDQNEVDDKVIAVAANDMSVNHIDDIDQLPVHFTKELKHFFEEYKKLEQKIVQVEDFQNKQMAFEIINQSIMRYNTNY
jgi:inorganic pyrophosphatase